MNISIQEDITKQIISNALNEDIAGMLDLTTDCLIPSDLISTFELVVNEDAVLAGINVFKETFSFLDSSVLVENNFNDGEKISKNQVIAKIFGKTKNILKAERTALNFICHLSGIATVTSDLVRLVNEINDKAILLDTRKTTPNMRHLERQAVKAGGGSNHRFNLSEMILIKDNHIKSSGGIKTSVRKAREFYKNKYKIEVEVNDFKELEEALLTPVDIIMFDNWKVSDLKMAIKLVPDHIKTEVSGNITPENIKEYAGCGPDYISTGYMIKNAKWIDFSLN